MPALYEPHALPSLCAWCAKVATVHIHTFGGGKDPACDEHAREWAFPWLGESISPIDPCFACGIRNATDGALCEECATETIKETDR